MHFHRFNNCSLITHLNQLVILAIAVIATSNCVAQNPATTSTTPETIQTFLQESCIDCHSGSSAEAGFDLETISAQLTEANSEKWTQVFDRVHAGEMPPADSIDVTTADRKAFLATTGDWIKKFQTEQFKLSGRARGRRLTNLQLERTLHDLLGVDIPLQTHMPEEPRTDGFTNVAAGQSMSHFQLEQHVKIVDMALDEAFRRALAEKRDEWTRRIPAEKLARRNPKRRTREPELINGHAVTWSAKLVFYGRIPATTAREDGWYRFKIRSKALKKPSDHGVWCTVRSGQCISSAPLMNWVGAYEANDKTKEVTFETWLPQGHHIEIRPGDSTLKMGKSLGGQVGSGEIGPQNVPGIAIESIEMARIHHGLNNDSIRELLFGDLKFVATKGGKKIQIESKARDQTIENLLQQFASRAFRRPASKEQVASYIAMTKQAWQESGDFVDAMRTGYRAILCSPRFIYFHETPGQLDDFAIASRLSYLLWNRMPDGHLMKLAEKRQLSKPWMLKKQVDKMLAHPRGKNFIKDLADQWLDMNQIDFTEPDRRMFFGFDNIVQNSMLDETHHYLQMMLDEDLNINHLIDSDFTFLNSRLARYYGIENVASDQIQKVSLKPADHRGGLLTHGSILKITANGTNTSPVIRGVWVSEKLLGQPIPPPPENVPAIEPDIRGAKTIRQMLAKHKEDGDCAACHRKIDPPGFALENFDPSGRWRSKYFVGTNRRRKPGPKVDASFTMPDGTDFQNLEEFKQIVSRQEHKLARNVVEKLLTYGTGATPEFSDRDAIEKCVTQAKKNDYGFKTLLKEVVVSDLFLSK